MTRDTEIFHRLLRGEPQNDAELDNSIYFLTRLLSRFYQKPVLVLIDEYDHLWNQFYHNSVILPQLTKTFAGLFSKFTKPSSMLAETWIQKVVFTGILRISKASVFSGLNNLTECTIFDKALSSYYGFNQKELDELLIKANQTKNSQSVMKWYNGYTMGSETIYNPWSIMQYLSTGEFKPYWVHTANQQLIKTLIVSNKGTPTNQLLKELIHNGPLKTIQVEARQHISVEDLSDPEHVWSFLLHTGYLTADRCEFSHEKGCFLCQVRVPNLEIAALYRSIISEWLKENPFVNQLVNAAFMKDYSLFFDSLQLILKSKSNTALFSRQEDSLEEVYHSFLLFVLNQDTLQPRYEILPEEPTGLGKADVLLVDHVSKQIIPIEIKRTSEPKELRKTAQEALRQAKEKEYGQLPQCKKYKVLPAMGIAFCAQKIAMKVHGLKKTYQI
jgi:hypothetical protein